MAFKPRVFISSTFSDNKKIREKIKKHFIELGAEPLLYESNLTPSTVPMAYRKDILEADFVILIMKDNYGKKTDWGISGTHEEYRIAKENCIPIHVYLLQSESTKNSLTRELQKDQVSYYYFKTESELIKRLKETTFIIAEEIVLKHLIQRKLPHFTVRQLSYNADYQRAIELIRSIEAMKKCHDQFGYDYLSTTIFTDYIEPITWYINQEKPVFINWKLDEALNEMASVAQEFMSNHSLDYTAIPNTQTKLENGNSGEVLVQRLSYKKNTSLKQEDYLQLLKDFFEKYEEFKDIIKEIKLHVDCNQN